jgi:hypothetical protein
MPVGDDVLVDTKWDDDSFSTADKAGTWCWDIGFGITHWRLHGVYSGSMVAHLEADNAALKAEIQRLQDRINDIKQLVMGVQ